MLANLSGPLLAAPTFSSRLGAPRLRWTFSTRLDRFGQTVPVHGAGITLGRSSECDVVLEDRGASRLHARIERAPDGGWVLLDLGSTNGTRVNGLRVRSARLHEGDRIEIGLVTSFEFALDAAAPACGARRGGEPAAVAA